MAADTQVQFFLGANAPTGFYSLYDQLIDPASAEDIFILKGGPGCGKSSLMRRVGRAMEEHGLAVEYILCSGDPDSLDAIVIPDLKAAIVDGTAPHIVEPQYPGVVERYVNLGACYDRAALAPLRGEITGCMSGYKGCYARAYRCLSAAAQINEDMRALLHTPSAEAKAVKRARGILSREVRKSGSEPGHSVQRFLGAVTWRGPLCGYDTAYALCGRIYELADTCGLAHVMLTHLAAGVMAAGYDVIVCPSPLAPDRMEHLLVPARSVGFISPTPPPPSSAPTAASGWTPWPTRRSCTGTRPACASPARSRPPSRRRPWSRWPRPRPCTTAWSPSITPMWTSTRSTASRTRPPQNCWRM